jgi:hypothetical protein
MTEKDQGPAEPTHADSAVRKGARVMGTLRALVGVAMIVAPRTVVRPKDGVAAAGDLVFMVRTIGVRDLALGLGTLVAASSTSSADPARWVRFGMVSDALDVVTGTASGGLLGRRGAASAALIPAPFVVADLWVLRSARR